ncbi:MAG: hypothetical protein AW10_00824 [Candidatus Accumulibacter appositus]|uniref:Uncharacterized protein n=1 Tax=Candidatus Accumulibacter appositus TaxID=1454003 RepID=A0A011NHB3_9PROT|nr:MAG: hypothetical protein AW10_00824 [Candidatus Accumulibacter appositus]
MGDGTAITTPTVNIGMGGTAEGGATGMLDFRGGSLTFAGADTSFNFGSGGMTIADGIDFTVGSADDRLGHLRIGYNVSGIGLADADINQTNDRFTAFVADELSVGRVANVGWQGQADGNLVLGTDSTIDLGTTAAPATLNIGWNESTGSSGFSQYLNYSSAIGLLNASEGALTAQLAELNVGLTAGRGTADGTLIMGDGASVNANVVNIGMAVGGNGTLTLVENFSGSFATTTLNLANGVFAFGNNTLAIGGAGSIAVEIVNLSGGLLSGNTVDLDSGGSFNFTGGRLDITTFNGSLQDDGGTLAAGHTAVGTTTLNGDYLLSTSGTLEIDLAGAGAGVGYDQLTVNGAVDLDGTGAVGGMLDLVLNFAAQLNDRFIIIENDGVDAISGEFFGLAEGGSLQEIYGGQIYSFAISYAGGDGNDVELTVTSIVGSPAPFTGAGSSSGSFTINMALSVGLELGDELVPSQILAAAGPSASAASALDTLDAESDSQPSEVAMGSDSEIVRFDILLDALSEVDGVTQAPTFPSSREIGSLADIWATSLVESGGAADAAGADMSTGDGIDGALCLDADASSPEGLPAVALPASDDALSLCKLDFVFV